MRGPGGCAAPGCCTSRSSGWPPRPPRCSCAWGLRIASGFGGRLRTEPYQSRHYAIMRWYLDLLYRTATRTFGVRVEVDQPELTADEQAARLTRPVIVLSRHAGPGDSFLLVRQLLSVYGRRPRVVMKATLQFDPGLDVMANRLPNVFISRRRTAEKIFIEQIERRPSGLGPLGALVIFPEGGNWTPGRWQRGIQRLEAAGHGRDLACRAREMPNLLAPRNCGALAAVAPPRCRRDLRGPRRAGPAGQRRRCLAEPADGPGRPGEMVAGASSARCRARPITRPGCSGSMTGGSASTPGSRRTAPATPWRRPRTPRLRRRPWMPQPRSCLRTPCLGEAAETTLLDM